MKKLVVGLGLLIVLAMSAEAQKTPKKEPGIRVSKLRAKKPQVADPPVVLISESNQAAKSSVVFRPSSKLSISDPLLTALDARARGADIRINKSGVAGMPKRAYGFANGHIVLSTTGATTSGTQTGSGSVGSGSSLGTFGSTGPAMGVNGKSPYAGINMWGNAMNISNNHGDSSVRTSPMKKQ